jgi:hypothetical protein
MLSTVVAKCRLWYHAEAIELNNVLNQLHIRKDDVAEDKAADHMLTIVNDILPRLYGQKAVDELFEKKEAH